MKVNSENLQTLMDDVIQEVKAKRQEVTIAEPEPSKPEKVETLDDLMKGWEDAKPKRVETKPLVWNNNVKPLEKKEDVYPYFKRRIMTGPYLCLILEHLFSVPHDMAYEIETDLTKEGFASGHIGWKEKTISDIELWHRVVFTCERNHIDGDFLEDAHKILSNRLSELNLLNFREEKRELSEGEATVRSTYKRRRY